MLPVNSAKVSILFKFDQIFCPKISMDELLDKLHVFAFEISEIIPSIALNNMKRWEVHEDAFFYMCSTCNNDK